jgi:hypothetical protein
MRTGLPTAWSKRAHEQARFEPCIDVAMVTKGEGKCCPEIGLDRAGLVQASGPHVRTRVHRNRSIDYYNIWRLLRALLCENATSIN